MVKKIRAVIIVILALMALSLLIGLLVKNRPTDTPSTPVEPTVFTVAYDGESYTASDGDIKISLPESGQAVFTVSGTDSYTVKVVSKSYGIDPLEVYGLIDGATYYIFDGKDYTTEFITADNLHEDYFAIDCTANRYELATLIKRIKNTDDFVIYNESGQDMTYPYLLQITSSDGEVIEIELNQKLTVYKQLKTPTLSVEVVTVNANSADLLFRFSDIDENADTIVLNGYWLNHSAFRSKPIGVDTKEYTLGVLTEGKWTFYIEVSDSTGEYLSGLSETLEIEIEFK